MDASFPAWLLAPYGLQPFAVAEHEIIEFLSLVEPWDIPVTPAYCSAVLFWRQRFIPLMDLGAIAGHRADSGLRTAAVLAYQLEPGAPLDYVAITLQEPPARLSVTDRMACDLPENHTELWQRLAKSCFTREGMSTPIISIRQLCSANFCNYAAELTSTITLADDEDIVSTHTDSNDNNTISTHIYGYEKKDQDIQINKVDTKTLLLKEDFYDMEFDQEYDDIDDDDFWGDEDVDDSDGTESLLEVGEDLDMDDMDDIDDMDMDDGDLWDATAMDVSDDLIDLLDFDEDMEDDSFWDYEDADDTVTIDIDDECDEELDLETDLDMDQHDFWDKSLRGQQH